MDIVYVYDVRIQASQRLYETSRREARSEAVPVEKTSFKAVQGYAQPTADRKQLRALRSRQRIRHTVPSPAISNPALPAAGSGQFTYLLHNLPRGSIPAEHRIYLQQLRHPYTHLTIFP